MFDVIINSKLNRLLEGGGYPEPGKVTVDLVDINRADLTVSGMGFTLISPLTPTKDELEKGKNAATFTADGASESRECRVKTVLFDDDMVYGGILGIYGDPIQENSIYFAVAYKAGAWAAGGVTIAKPGMYMSCDYDIASDATVKRGTVVFGFEWETIHPIDPKYLPVVELTTVPTENGAALTEEESAFFAKAAADNIPVVVKVPGDITTVYTMNLVSVNGNVVVYSGKIDTNLGEGTTTFMLQIYSFDFVDFFAAITMKESA